LALKTTFGYGAIKENTWMEANYDWGNSAFRASCLASLNESVRSVAGALGLLLFEGGVTPVPEFGMFEIVVIASAAIPVTICCRIRYRDST